jgi:hypothetical protein
VAEFKRVINASRQQCRLNRSPRIIDRKFEVHKHHKHNTFIGTCPEKTIEALFTAIPGDRTTTRQFAGADLMKTFELCATRENGGGSDWREITLVHRVFFEISNTVCFQ